MIYTDFAYGTDEDGITNWNILTLPVHGASSPANLFARVTGIAQAMQGDPPWDRELLWHRGRLTIQTSQIFDYEDKLVSACVTVGFGRIDRDVNYNAPDDFSIALDEIASVNISGGSVNIVIHAAYQGDAVAPNVAFSADLLLYRTTLYDPTPHPRWPIVKKEVRYTVVASHRDAGQK
jgi:hypothetical protein